MFLGLLLVATDFTKRMGSPFNFCFLVFYYLILILFCFFVATVTQLINNNKKPIGWHSTSFGFSSLLLCVYGFDCCGLVRFVACSAECGFCCCPWYRILFNSSDHITHQLINALECEQFFVLHIAHTLSLYLLFFRSLDQPLCLVLCYLFPLQCCFVNLVGARINSCIV